MAAPKFNRWDNALKKCMENKGAKGKGNRWKSDPLVLNQEAHDLSPEKQREALDAIEEAPQKLRDTLVPIWKFNFVQWHVYDAAQEAAEKGTALGEALAEEGLFKDAESLRAVFESGGLGQAQTAEAWTWDLLEPLPPSGTIEPWNDATAAPVMQVGRAARKKGVHAFAEGEYTEAFRHCCEGLKLMARAPGGITGSHAKVRCDLYKNKAAAALKLKLPRIALKACSLALVIDGADPKAWHRKSCAYEILGRDADARAARANAGLEPKEEEQPRALAALGGGAAASLEDEAAEPVEELEPRFHRRFEDIKFIEVGIDSLAAVDMVMYLKAELQDVPIPLTLAFDCPSVRDAVEVLLKKIQAEVDPQVRPKMNNVLWRSMCKALGTDPVKGVLDGRLGHVTWPAYSVEEASALLWELKSIYEEESFVKCVRTLAKEAAFEQRAFLVRLRAVALAAQRPFLEKHGFDPDFEGLRQLECALVNVGVESPLVREQLQAVRMAQQGGPNGMWAVNMEQDEGEPVWADCHSLQCWSQFMQAHPFGADMVNTNSVMTVA